MLLKAVGLILNAYVCELGGAAVHLIHAFELQRSLIVEHPVRSGGDSEGNKVCVRVCG